MITRETLLTVSAANLSALPTPVADCVREIARSKRTRHFRFSTTDGVSIDEDAKYTAFSPDGSLSKSASAAGEWHGLTGLRPGAFCPLPTDCWLVEGSWFLGKYYLRLYKGAAPQINASEHELAALTA